VVAVHQDLGLHDRHQAVLLHRAGVAGQAPGVLAHRQLRGSAVGADLQHGAPFGEAGTTGVIAGRPLRQALQPGAPALARHAAGQGLHPLVHLDAGNNALLLKQLHDRAAAGLGGAVLEEGFLVEDHAGDVLAEAVGASQQAAVGAAVLLGVLEANGVESFADRAGGFIRRQQARARRRQGCSGGGKLLAEIVEGHGAA
jgi:hypothetical protein